jgi:TetR/AcrR family transcriptional regulator
MARAKDTKAKLKILEAADALFARDGVDAVSVRDISREAGVSKASVFYYFAGKDGLYAAVLNTYYEAHKQALDAALEREGELPTRLHAVLDAYLDFISSNARYARMVQRQLTSGGDIEVVGKNLGALLHGVENALEGATPATGPLAARHFFVTLSGAVINYFTYAPALESMWGSDPLSPEAVAERRAHLHWLVDAMLARLAL